jgi:hypothetical protein
MAVMLSVLRAARPLPPGKFLVLVSLINNELEIICKETAFALKY